MTRGQKVGSDGYQEDVSGVRHELAPVGVVEVLDQPSLRVPAEVDRNEGHGKGEEPNDRQYGAVAPPAGRVSTVSERHDDRQVAVEADDEQRQDGNRAEHDVRRDEQVAEDGSEWPGVREDGVEDAEWKNEAAEQQVADGQREDEEVGDAVQSSDGRDRDADEQVAEHRRQVDQTQHDPDRYHLD